MMTRITLARASAIIAVLAIGCGAMRTGSEEGEQAVFALVVAVHVAGLVGLALRRGSDPAWLGFAAFGWAFLLTTNDDWLNGPKPLPLSGLARSAYEVVHPEPPPPVVDGKTLDEEPDKMTATDAMLKAYNDHQTALGERNNRLGRVGSIADLLTTILAAALGAWLGPRLAPRPPRD